jgi:hypothetical protein
LFMQHALLREYGTTGEDRAEAIFIAISRRRYG